MSRYIATLVLLPLTLAIIAAVGCGDSAKRYPVKGIVLIDGQPLTQGYITVAPSNDRPAIGKINSDGTFSLTTEKPNDGCAPGTHPVEITASESLNNGTAIRWLVPPKYQNMSTSELKITVDGPQDNLKIELTWAGGQPYVESTVGGGDQIPE